MRRIVSALLLVGLLSGTAAAFAVTERLKLVRSPVYQTHLDRGVFSPVCLCETDSVEIGFRLRNEDRVTLTVVDSAGTAVRTLVDGEERDAGPLTVRWNGRDDEGRVVPEGTYRPRVHLARQQWTIELPNPLRVDTTPPRIVDVTVEPRTFSPDGDGRADRVAVRYRLGERGRALLHVDGEQRVTARRFRTEGKVEWHGRANGEGLPPGEYELTVVAVDRVGNRSRPSEPVAVTIRYVEVAPAVVRVRAGQRFAVDVDADADMFAWRFAGRDGTAEPGSLVLRAPLRPGRYAVVAEVGERGARANVIVEPRRAR